MSKDSRVTITTRHIHDNDQVPSWPQVGICMMDVFVFIVTLVHNTDDEILAKKCILEVFDVEFKYKRSTLDQRIHALWFVKNLCKIKDKPDAISLRFTS